MERKYYVYEWYFTSNGNVFYVGKGTGNRYLTTGRRSSKFLEIVNNYETSCRIIYDNLTEDEAFDLERKTIIEYKKDESNCLINVALGGRGTLGVKLSDEAKQGISIKMKQKWLEPEYRNKVMHIRRDENGPYKNETYRLNMAIRNLGESNPNYGNRWSEEQKEALRQKQIKNDIYYGDKNPNSKRVMCVETGEIFNTVNDAARKMNIKCPSSISICLSNPTRLSNNTHWVQITPHNEQYFKDNHNRFLYLIEVLKQSKSCSKPIACLEDETIFNSVPTFCTKIEVPTHIVAKQLNLYGKYIHNNKTYVYVKNL